MRDGLGVSFPIIGFRKEHRSIKTTDNRPPDEHNREFDALAAFNAQNGNFYKKQERTSD
jgi:hypothetical protein